MTYTITHDNTVATLQDPTSITLSTSRTVRAFTSANGTRFVFDSGRTSEQVTISGWEASTPSVNMGKLETIMDGGYEATVAGLSDTNLNTTYYIENLSFEQPLGHMNTYTYTITLEKST